ncbi:MIF4G multi-domain protein [Pyrenophora tritici-repentis]|nr:MIF4G multi-domain protein [Pyrenophora tritici-repentis]KAI1541256.1 MIF4G multi-domain protein [Pyrenophora tritici-repentis]KAI1590962.1 MIF4G multi-domain protein [Pyrenophora tritici-repentis]KAI1601574.1 MIF4G multi-domain protein [Pyrenophora tritici-repentis]PWO24488.1 SPS1, Serinethreonine protein kinase [Pyrenophora tritici-repentis]
MRKSFGGPKLPAELRNQLGDPANNKRRNGSRNGPPNRKDKRKADRVEKKQDRAKDQNATPPPIEKKEPQKPLKGILKAKPQQKEEASPPPAKLSRAARDKLAQDDAEIAALEKRLGVKGKKKSKGADDGLDDIFGDLGDFSDEEAVQPAKRKRKEDDDWLASKRRKALGQESSEEEDSAMEDGDSDSDLDLEDTGFDDEDEDETDDEDGDLGSEDETMEDEEPERPRVRENPYVAPIAPDAQPTKYIPPALRAPPSSDTEALMRLKRQIQGLFNRLSEANILSILKEIEAIYQNNPRGYVNNTLVDLLIGMLSDPTALLDTFLNLHAGFIAAIYKVIGPDFGAQIVERIVAEFDQHYQPNKDGHGKQTSNLTSVVAELYTYQVIGSNIVFDYIRVFLDELTEINTELLLRIVKAAGPQLRQDDPTSLKDIVVLLQKSVAKVGQSNLPVRTKFMIETINDLKNNKMKTGIASSALSREHTTRMKKQLGTLNSRNLKATEPLRVGLKDIKDTEKRGKWWLVGASWRNEPGNEEPEEEKQAARTTAQIDNEDDDSEVDLVQLAREHRMNTDIRRAIFISIMSASDFKDAQIRLNKLNLKKAQEAEIPRVIVHCAGAEKTYNPYYTVLARKICSDHKTRKSFQFALWDIFKGLGEKQDGADESDDEEDEASSDTSLRKLVNQGTLYGTLIGRKAMPITSLKNLNFPYLQPKTKTFVEVLLVTTILEALKTSKSKDKRDERVVREVFVEVDQAPEMIAGLQFFLKKTVSKTEIVDKSEKETVRWACKSIMDMLTRILATTTMQED